MSDTQATQVIKQDSLIQLQNFIEKLNREPDQSELERTPDGKAKTVPISFVEMTLDELFLGQWGTENFKWSAFANEVQGSLELVLTHPITGKEIRRTGAASIIVTVDALTDEEKAAMGKQARNLYAISPENKKPNALDLGFPKLKAECTKNAAQSLGKVFGRDLNRKKADKFQAPLKPMSDGAFKALLERVEKGDFQALALAETNFLMSDIQQTILSGLKEPQKQLNGSV
ncbi:MAG TPA: hypothetical protein VFZ33_16910 [Chitinophagaceae bacterium]